MNNNHHIGNQISQINDYIYPSDTITPNESLVNPMNVSHHNYSINNNNIAGYNSINNINNTRQSPTNHDLVSNLGTINNSFVGHNTLHNAVDNNINNARQNSTSNNNLANHLDIINNRSVGHNNNILHNTVDNNFFGQNSVNNNNNNLGAQTNNYTWSAPPAW
jgi:hypothetical protein